MQSDLIQPPPLINLVDLFGELLSRRIDIELVGEPKLLDSIVVNGPESLPVRLASHGA